MSTTSIARQEQREARQERPARRKIAIAAGIGFLLVVAFQIALTMGAPFGEAALGGANAGTLPDELRVVTAVNILIWTLATLIVLARGGVAISAMPRGLARWGTWVLVGLLALGAVMNFASFSPWERFGMAPFTLLLFVLTLLLARGGFGGVRASKTRVTT